VRGRLAYLFKPAGKVDPQKRRAWDLLTGPGAERSSSRGHDRPELYESAAALKFLLAD
jgi:hypothetical protein